MQNKPNLQNAQINISFNLTKDYDNKSGLWTMQKQTQTKPNKPEANLPHKGAQIPTQAAYFDTPGPAGRPPIGRELPIFSSFAAFVWQTCTLAEAD